MKKLSVRYRGGSTYEIGPAGLAPTVTVTSMSKKTALKEGKKVWQQKYSSSVQLPTRKKLTERKKEESNG